MAAARKHLHELLQEDQEPFQLKNYINDRRSQLKRPNPNTTSTKKSRSSTASSAVQIRKRKPVGEASLSNTTVSKQSLCKHACFFSFNDSPDVRKSPFPDFRSPARSPCSSSSRTKNGTVYLDVPTRTAALLLEAAMRIQKQQSSSTSFLKPKSQNKNMGFGLFSSIIKKLKDRNRNRNRKCGIQGTEPEILQTSGSKLEERNMAIASSGDEVCSSSYNNSRLSTAGWSESYEEISLDMETSTSSCRSQDYEGIDFAAQHSVISCASCETQFFSSPLSPFRFSLQKSSSSSGRRTPDFSPPAASPIRYRNEGKKKLYEGNGFAEECKLSELQEEEEEKEQCSPVSVLDPSFEDEDDGHEEDNEEVDEDEDYDDLECSFAFVQRATEQLLYKLRRFEKLAELDPIELEKRMMEQLDDEDESEDIVEEGGKCKCVVDNEFSSPSLQRGCSRSNGNLDSFVNEVCIKSSLHNRRKLPTDMKRLVSDLISEENREFRSPENKEMVVGRVCKKLDSWREVESNTIDMMVELDFRTELNEWKKFQEQRDEIAVEIEFAIFDELLDHLSQELLLLRPNHVQS